MGLLEDRRTQHQAREKNRSWGLALSGRSPIVSPMYGDRQAGREQSPITVEPPDGRHLTVDVASQTWNGRLDLGGTVVQDIGWSSQSPVTGATDEATAPTGGYYDLHVDLDTDEVDGVTVSVEVDGTEVASSTLDLHGRLMAVIPVGSWTRGTALTILSDKAVAVSGGRVAMQVIEPPVGRVGDTVEADPPEGTQSYSYAGEMDDPTATATTGPPSAVVEGDLMLFALTGNEILGAPSTPSIPSGTTEITTGLASNRGRLAWRRATADDEAGTTSYSSTANGAVFIGILRIPQDTVPSGTDLFGAVESTATNDGTTHPSVTAPEGGDWILAVAFGWSMASFQGNEAISFPSGASHISPPVSDTASDDYRSGRHRIGTADPGATITTSYGSRYFGTDSRWRVVYAIEVKPGGSA